MLVSSILVLIPLVAAHNQPNYRRHQIRDAVNIARAGYYPRAGAPIDNGTLASISAEEASESLASSTSASALPSSAASASSSSASVLSSSISSAVDSQVASSSSAAPSSSAVISSSAAPASTATSTVPTTINQLPTTLSPTSEVLQTSSVVHVSSTRTITSTSRATASASAAAASSSSSSSSGGLSKGALIGIIVAAAVVGLVVIGFTAFRKWKLKPSNRFDSKMKPIDFSPQNGMGNDDFFEKTLQRTASHSDADRQRQQFVSELDHRGVDGIPEHDFTATSNMAGHGTAGMYDPNMYHQDPYMHAEQYDYDAQYYHQAQAHDYPPTGHQQVYDYPTQDQPVDNGAGYADLQRGPSVGSGSGHGHGQAMGQSMAFPEPQLPSAGYGLGRPTGGSDGPYAQAAQYRGY